MSPADPAEYPAAARALFAHLPAEERTRRADRVVGMIAVGEIDPTGLLVARDGDAVVGAILIQFHPGSAAVVSLPGAERDGVAEALALAAVERLRAAGVKQAQSMVPPAELGRSAPLERAGFRHVSRLVHFCRPVPGAALPGDPNADALTFTPYPTPGFADVLLATYDDTLDCPELNGTRTGDEIVAGYRSGAADPPEWWLVSRDSEPVGVVMLAPGPQQGIAELSYLGLVRKARGKRLGQGLVRFVVEQVQRTGNEWLTLSADERNFPATQLYSSNGFREYDRQHVFLWTSS